eukprot:1595222-Amphidinium_carterae.1
MAAIWNLMLQARLRITGCSMDIHVVMCVLFNPDGDWPRLRLLTQCEQLTFWSVPAIRACPYELYGPVLCAAASPLFLPPPAS